MPKIKVLITVKTYPTLSAKYDELVCTAGFTEEGKWIRIYPIKFRQMGYEQQYKKYDWIEIDLVKNTSDARSESFRPITIETEPSILNHINTDNYWHERKAFCLKNVYTNLAKLISDAKNREKSVSLATFKPTKIIDFVWKEVDRAWDKEKLEAMQQMSLFEQNKQSIEVVKKLPYKFSYIFEDDEGKESKLMIEDWEVAALYWNAFYQYKSEQIACEKVKQKYLHKFTTRCDLYFFLGTTKANHFRAPNPFIIIGAFYPKKDVSGQLNLF